jgi:hypothetical protein
MRDARLSVLLKGASGSAKTETALSFPDPIRVIYTDVNRETVRKAIARGVKIEGTAVRTWSEYSDQIVPTLVSRKFEGNTIVVDTVDFLSALMWKDIEGTKARLAIQDFGTGLRRLSETTRALVSLTLPEGDHPGYHVVFTSHLKDVSDDSGALLKVAPAIMGQFANQIEDYFDYVLLMQSELASKVETVNGVTKNVKSKQFKIWSVPPDRYHTCKGGDMPAELIVPQGTKAFDLLNEYWKV